MFRSSAEESCEDGVRVGKQGLSGQAEGVGADNFGGKTERGDMIQTWKILNNKEDVDPRTWFKMVNENGEEQRTRGHSLDIYKPRSKLEMRTYFFSSRVTEQCSGGISQLWLP